MPFPPENVYQRERASATRGILFLLQHHTDELQTREDQYKALIKLTSKHTFSRLKGSAIYDSVKMRVVGAELAGDLSIEYTQFEDKFDLLCHEGIAAVPDDMLAYFEYNPETFTEAQLPAYDPSASTGEELIPTRRSGGEKRSYSQRATWIVLQDIDKVKHHATDPDYKYRTSKHVAGALRHLILQYSLHEQPGADGRTHNFDPVKLMRVVDQMNQKVLQKTRTECHIRAKKMPRRLNPVWSRGTGRLEENYLWQLESTAQHREDLDGTSSYGQASIKTLFRYTDVIKAMKRHGHDVSIVEAAPRKRQGVTKTAIVQSIKESKQKDDGSDEDISVYDHGASSSHVMAVDSEEVKVSSEHVPLGRRSRRHTRTELSMTPGPGLENDSDAPKLSSSPSMNSLHLVVNGRRGTRSSNTYDDQNLVHTQSPSRLTEVIDIDLGTITKDIQQLHSVTKKLIDNLFATLKLKTTLTSPFEWEADAHLETVYKRCLGADWREIVSFIQDDNLAFAPDILSSLVSAWIFDQVFVDDTPWQSFMKSNLSFARRLSNSVGTGGELATLFENYVMPHATQQAYALDFVSKLHEESMADLLRDAAFARATESHARKATSQLTSVLDPHMRGLYDVAKMLNAGVAKYGWQTQLQSGIEGIITQAIKLKAKLCYATFSNYQHRFIWPEHKSSLDTLSMQARWDEPDGEVMLACFPGLEVRFANGTVDNVYRAQVIARPSFKDRSEIQVVE